MLKNMKVGKKLILTFALVTIISSISETIGLVEIRNMSSNSSTDFSSRAAIVSMIILALVLLSRIISFLIALSIARSISKPIKKWQWQLKGRHREICMCSSV